MKALKILFVTTSHDKMGDTAEQTGVWLEEIASPYYVFTDAGASITWASPNGGKIPIDPKSQSIILATFNTKRFLKNEVAMSAREHSMLLDDVDADDFDVLFIAGGHGPMWDLVENKKLKQLLESFNRDGKPIGAVCHGVVGLITMQNENGELSISGKQLTGFSNSEESASGLTNVVPFLLETKLVSLGALYSKGADYVGHVVTDGNIITGQNPASSKAVAQKILAFVQDNKIVEKLQPVVAG